MKQKGLIIVISFIAIISIAYYLSSKPMAVMRPRRIAPFVDTSLGLDELPEGTAPASLRNRIPYHALDEIPSKMGSKLGELTACSCRAIDTTAAIERVGNFRQITNNYKRGTPDSCSAPNQELVGAFYNIKPINVIST